MNLSISAPCRLLVLLSLAFGSVGCEMQTSSRDEIPDSEYVDVAHELIRMHQLGLFEGGKVAAGDGTGTPVTVRPGGADTFSALALTIARQSAALSNDLVAADYVVPASLDDLELYENAYPELFAFFRAAARAEVVSGTDPAPSRPDVQALVGVSEATGRLTCGWYVNPKPTGNRSWVQFSVSNPAATLRAWGYHETPSLAGGGWTRAQTWNPALCGFGTYRDHAYPSSASALKEQNYAGWTPRGEPNPEVYRTGPWPYSDWPAYVYWWHFYGPGR